MSEKGPKLNLVLGLGSHNNLRHRREIFSLKFRLPVNWSLLKNPGLNQN